MPKSGAAKRSSWMGHEAPMSLYISLCLFKIGNLVCSMAAVMVFWKAELQMLLVSAALVLLLLHYVNMNDSNGHRMTEHSSVNLLDQLHSV